MEIVDVVPNGGKDIIATINIRLFRGYKAENDHLWTNRLGNRTEFPIPEAEIHEQIREAMEDIDPEANLIIVDFSNGGSPLKYPEIRDNWAKFADTLETIVRASTDNFVTKVKFHMTITGQDIYTYAAEGAIVDGISELPSSEHYIPDYTYLTLACDQATRETWMPDCAPVGDMLNLLSGARIRGSKITMAVPMILGYADDMNDFSRVVSQAKAVNIKDMIIADFHSHDESFWRSVDLIDKQGAADFAKARGFTVTIEGQDNE